MGAQVHLTLEPKLKKALTRRWSSPRRGSHTKHPQAMASPRRAPAAGQALGCMRLGEQRLLPSQVPLGGTSTGEPGPWAPSFSWML